jgi:hypothetical protein
MLRAQLITAMEREDVQIAYPAKYSGIDLLAYLLPQGADSLIQAVPIQLATMSYGTFLRDFAAWRTSGLLVVILRDEREPESERTLALSAAELMLVQMEGLLDESAEPSLPARARTDALRRAFDPYCMGSGGWHAKISRWIADRQSAQVQLSTSQIAPT